MTNHYIVDDRSVDYFALHALMGMQQDTNSPPTLMGMTLFDASTTTNLWLEIPTNGVASNVVNVILHNTSYGLLYALLTKPDLDYPFWFGEQTITGAVGNATSAVLAQYDRTNLYIWARSGVASTIRILTQPMSQNVGQADDVTFSVVATGVGSLHYQWTFNGTNILGRRNFFSVNLLSIKLRVGFGFAC